MVGSRSLGVPRVEIRLWTNRVINTYDADACTATRGVAYPADETRIFLPCEQSLFVREIFHSRLFFHRLSARPSSCSSRLSAIEELDSNRVSPVISGPRAPCNRIRPFRAIFVSACKLDGTSETFPEPALNHSFPENVDSGLIELRSNYFIFGNWSN